MLERFVNMAQKKSFPYLNIYKCYLFHDHVWSFKKEEIVLQWNMSCMLCIYFNKCEMSYSMKPDTNGYYEYDMGIQCDGATCEYMCNGTMKMDTYKVWWHLRERSQYQNKNAVWWHWFKRERYSVMALVKSVMYNASYSVMGLIYVLMV